MDSVWPILAGTLLLYTGYGFAISLLKKFRRYDLLTVVIEQGEQIEKLNKKVSGLQQQVSGSGNNQKLLSQWKESHANLERIIEAMAFYHQYGVLTGMHETSIPPYNRDPNWTLVSVDPAEVGLPEPMDGRAIYYRYVNAHDYNMQRTRKQKDRRQYDEYDLPPIRHQAGKPATIAESRSNGKRDRNPGGNNRPQVDNRRENRYNVNEDPADAYRIVFDETEEG